MTRRGSLVLALLLMLPVTLDAQGRRGSGTGGGTGAGTGGGGGPAGGPIGRPAGTVVYGEKSETQKIAKDLEDANPIAALLDAKKTLKLSREEEDALKSLNRELKNAIKPLLKALDSVSIQARYSTATDSAMTKLIDEHRRAAKDLLQKQNEARLAKRRSARPPL